ncbi:MAG: hypothetical protein JO189_09605 [Deltaproteobacteria bacterium]|nr:hypothetical protein [Deltaproteobacteria bacterium]
MNRLNIATRGIASWRARLAGPERQWKRRYSAFETAVSWEFACKSKSGLPAPIYRLFQQSQYGEAVLIFAVAEHKVDLPGGIAASQCDVWAVLQTPLGMLSLAVEAKAGEPFGDAILGRWLEAGESDEAKRNRRERWNYIRSHLPELDFYPEVRYQILHRCAAAVIEAKRLGYHHAAFVVQVFDAPATSFQDYTVFCKALGIDPAPRGKFATTSVKDISLSVGWADCDFATDAEVAATTV